MAPTWLLLHHTILRAYKEAEGTSRKKNHRSTKGRSRSDKEESRRSRERELMALMTAVVCRLQDMSVTGVTLQPASTENITSGECMCVFRCVCTYECE